ncbi:methionyl-tRNA synthetase [Indivirus ILV1]|uniref:methionine--tRNA ligase n=1 Tax=Indivirus ILV1 TaxID=1977633 RepID=A0A1V0SDF2_9VIRU|nr:methionyl-tRNA synthetase [Indivirus ILV1]
MSKRILVTSALPYCNNIPHLGNIIGSTLSADVYSRFKRLQGANVLYVCGTDCYGTTTEVKAEQEKLSCEEICHKYSILHKQVYDWFNIQFDVWGQTNTLEQTEITHEIFLELYKNGYISEKTITQMYCPKCEKFLADRYLKGICYHLDCNGKNNITNGDQCDSCQKMIDVEKLINPYCYMCKTTPYLKETDHLYLNLDILESKIKEYIFDSKKVKLNDNAISITKTWLDNKLEPRCITRDLKWGTPVPIYNNNPKNKVFYVWFDAPFGYYSIIKRGLENHNYKEWLEDDGNIEWVLAMGKDNIAFHTIFFPGSILGSGLSLPKPNKLCTTDYLNYEGQKFSKSNNIGIFGDQVANISHELGITEDYWRFYLLKIRPESHDTSFDWNEFISTCNSDLVNNIGNYINRCVSMTFKYLNGQCEYVPNEYVIKVSEYISEYNQQFEEFRFIKAVNQCINLGTYGNQYLQMQTPWYLAKNLVENKEKLSHILGSANMICYHLIKLLLPFIPNTAQKLLKLFNFINQDNLLNNNSTIILNNSNYDLPFKPLDKDTVKEILSRLNVKSSLQ